MSPLGSSWLPRAGRRLEARSTLTSFSASRRPRVRRRLPNSVFLFPGWRRPRGRPRPSLSSSCVFTPAGTRGSLFPCVTIHHYLRNTLARARPPSPLCPSEPVPASGSRHRWRRLRAGALREGRGGPAEERWQPMLSPGLGSAANLLPSAPSQRLSDITHHSDERTRARNRELCGRDTRAPRGPPVSTLLQHSRTFSHLCPQTVPGRAQEAAPVSLLLCWTGGKSGMSGGRYPELRSHAARDFVGRRGSPRCLARP